MATVYSTLIVQGVVPTSPAVVYEVPAGYRLVLRDVDGMGPNGDNAIILSEAIANENFAIIAPTLVSVPTTTINSYEWRGRQVFEEGQELQWAAYFDLIFARMSGYLLAI